MGHFNFMAKDKPQADKTEVPLAQTAEWAQWSKEAALEQAEAAAAATEAELSAAYDDSTEDIEGGKRSKDLDKELADDWLHLKRIAMTKFPEGAALLGLTPKNRLVAIAHCLGWTQDKISKASGVSLSTIRRWIDKRPDIKVFIDEFNLRTGDKDVIKSEWPTLEYKSVQFIKELLNDKSTSDATRRLKMDAAKWIFERSRGRPGQEIEINADGLRTMLELLGKQQVSVLTPKDEKALFSPSVNTKGKA